MLPAVLFFEERILGIEDNLPGSYGKHHYERRGRFETSPHDASGRRKKGGTGMKVVAFFGSPRIGGNTDILLQEALKPIKAAGHEVVQYNLNAMNIRPCQDCGGCTKTGVCIMQDAMTEIYDAIRTADRFIIASPIF